ncbi:MAG: site-specific integrase [Lachnospiraceae bacterium]|nr:site-specific integrase [Lachnospiraceae bacterium]
MARHGENIRKRKDGRWEGRLLVYDKEKEKKIYRSVYGHTYDEVQEKLVLQKNLIKTGTIETESKTALCDIKFSDMAQEWLIEIKNIRKPSTYIKYNTIYQNHIKHVFQNAMLSDITDASVMEKISDHLSDSTSKSIYCILNQILKFISRRYSVAVPVLKKPVISSMKKAFKVLGQSEQKRLITTLYQKMDLFKMAVVMSLFTGLRLGEICALKWSDIDIENKILVVNRTVQRLPAEGQKTKTILIETMPKSEYSRREIPFSDTMLDLLIQFPNNKEYVFGGDKPLEPRTLQYHFKKILKDAELEEKNFHILRHTFATNCIEGGMDVKSLSEILGHSDVQITLQLYVHPSMDIKRQGMDYIAQFYNQIRGQIHGQAV